MIYLLNRNAALKMFDAELLYTKLDGSAGTVDGKPVIIDNTPEGTTPLCSLVSTDDLGLKLRLTIGDVIPDENAESNFTIKADVDLGKGVKELAYEVRIIWVSQVSGVSMDFKEVTE